MSIERISFALYRALHVGGLVRRFGAPHLVCFGYHDIGVDGDLSVSTETLRAQLRAIQKMGYTFVTLEDVQKAVTGKKTLPRRSALLYFDDGRAGIVKARIVREEFGIQPVFFLTPALFGKEGYIDAVHIPELAFGDIGAHGFSHKRFALMTTDEVMSEMTRAKDELSMRTGKHIFAWSYPHSDPDDLSPESAFRAGFSVVIGDGRGVNTFPLSGFLKKIPMSADDAASSITAKIGGWYALWNAMVRIKRSLRRYPKTASVRVWRVGGVFRRVRIVLDDAVFLVARRRGGWSYLTLISHTKFSPYPSMRVREKRTLVVDVTKNDDELLASFSDTCRNEIRRTFRDDALRFSVGKDDMRAVMRLYRAFRKDKKLLIHRKSYFDGSLMFRAYLGGTLVSVVTAYPGTVARVQHIFSLSAVDKETKNRIAYASRRLLYECMRYARDHGSVSVDLAGINVTRSEKAGITAFKRSFGGTEIPEYTYSMESVLVRLLKRKSGKSS